MADRVTRRNLLTTASGIGIAMTAIPLAASVHGGQATDHLPAMLENWRREREVYDTTPDESAWDRMMTWERQIVRTVPITPSGAAAKLEWMLEIEGWEEAYEGHHTALVSTIQGLKAIEGDLSHA